MHRDRLEYTTTGEAIDLLRGFVSGGGPCLLQFDFGQGVRVDIQYSPSIGLATRTTTRKWREAWEVDRSITDVEELLDETRRFLPLVEDHSWSKLDVGWDRHRTDPLYFADRRTHGSM